MKPKATGKIIIMTFSALIIFLFSMCEDFQEKTFQPDDTDAYAIEVFNDTNLVAIPVGQVTFDEASGSYSIKAGPTTTSGLTNYAAVMSVLSDSNLTVEAGTHHYQVVISKTRQNALLLNVSGDKELHVYTTSYVDVNVHDNTGSAMDVDRSHPFELVSGLYTYDVAKDQYPVPTIKTKSVFELSSGEYVLNITATEATKLTTFSLVVVEKQ
ncbi:MAG: hypothetical protein JXQ65_04380 [Candidatus Marinimicrobia bacterium]|nr:hypothetical protein [Candidatus Neomarinimicrobiota bacterium]